MIDSKNIRAISFTEDYLITCCIFRLRPEEVLANLISLISFDASMIGSNNKLADAANWIVSAYQQQKEGKYLIHEKYKFTHSRCREVLETIFYNKNLTMEAKISELVRMEKWCYQLISESGQFANKLLLPEGREIHLPVGFTVLCLIMGIDHVSFLQFFINQVSWVRYVAIKKINESDYNPFMHFITEMHNRTFKDSAALRKAGYFDLLIKMHQFQKTKKNAPDEDLRLTQYNHFLKGIFQRIKDIPIEPVPLSYGNI